MNFLHIQGAKLLKELKVIDYQNITCSTIFLYLDQLDIRYFNIGDYEDFAPKVFKLNQEKPLSYLCF